jgi:hypothetical protein
MDLTDFAGEVVKKFNVHNIEPHSRHFRSLDSAYLASLHDSLKKSNAKAVNIAVDGPEVVGYGAVIPRGLVKHVGEVRVRLTPSVRVHINRAKAAPDVRAPPKVFVKYPHASKNVVVNLKMTTWSARRIFHREGD